MNAMRDPGIRLPTLPAALFAVLLTVGCAHEEPPVIPDPEEIEAAQPPLPAIEPPGPEGLPPPGDTIRRPTETPRPQPPRERTPPPRP